MSKMRGIRGASARTLSSLGCIAALVAASSSAAAEPTEPSEPRAPVTAPPAAQAPAQPRAQAPAQAPAQRPPQDPSWTMEGAAEDAGAQGSADATAGEGAAAEPGAAPGTAPATELATELATEPTTEPTTEPGASAPPADTPDAAAPGTDAPPPPPRYALPAATERAMEPAPDPETVPFTHHQLRWEVQVGLRNSWIPSDGFDAFAENDAFTQVGVGVGRGLFRSDRWSVAALGSWEYGSKGATVRGADSRFSAHRLTIALEGRYHALHWLYGYGRLAPGATHTKAHLDAPGQSFSHEARTWVASADVALGVAARLLGNPDGREPGERIWFFVEGGYGWSATQKLLLRPTGGAPERANSVDLGELALSGGFGRAGLLLSF